MTFLFNADLVWIKQRKRCLFKCNQLILDAVWDWMWLWQRGQSNSSVLLLLFPEEPYYRFKSWRSSRNGRVCSHAYTVIYPWHLLMFLTYFFFPSNECTDTQTHSQRFLPLFASDYIKHPGCTNRDGQTSLCRISANCGSSDNRHATLKNSWKRCGSTTQPPLLQSVMNTGPVCCRQKGGAHTQSHKHTHLYVEANISHLLAAARTTIQFSPVTQTHTSSHIHKEAHWLFY